MAPWADYMFAMDLNFWNVYGQEARDKFKGQRLSTAASAKHSDYVPIQPGGNSGAGAIMLARREGAERIILLGYDCQTGPGGEVHHHGDHPKGRGNTRLGNAGSLPKWPEQFRRLAQMLGTIEIINATRRTALDVWPCQPLEQALAE